MIPDFGELIPKTIALSKAEKFALKIAPLIRIIIILLFPLTKILNFIVGLILKMLGIDYKNVSKEEILEQSEEELRGAIDLHGNDSTGKEEKQMLKSILDLDDITVGSIMISRKDIYSLPSDTSYTDLILKLKFPHSRIPIWKKNPENIVGVLHVRKLIGETSLDQKKFNILNYCQKLTGFIPAESTKLDNQLIAFKRRKEHFSIVVDEYGEFLGIITLEDIIEEIVGDIDDELDDLKLSKNENGIKETSKKSFLVNGTVNIRDLNKQIGTDLPINNASTVAGLILYESRIIPKKVDFSFFGLKFKILSKKNNQLLMLKISKNN